MRSSLFRLVLALGLVAGLSSAASAATITFDLGDLDGIPDSTFKSVTVSGLTLNLTATYSTGDYDTGTLYYADLDFEGSGVGIDNNQNDGSDQIDSSGYYDILFFDVELGAYASAVLTQVRFGDWGSNDDAYLWHDGDSVSQNWENEYDYYGGFGNNGGVWSVPGLGGPFFALHGHSSNDDFRVKKLTFEVTERQVPEPASLVLFGTGLLGTGMIVRRRRARS